MNEDKDMTGTKLNTRSGRSLVGIVAAAAIAATAGCAGGGGSTPSSNRSTVAVSSSTPSMSIPSSSPSASTSTDPLAKKKAAAIAAVVAFWKKVDQLDALPKGDLTLLDLVARGQVLAQYQYNIGAARQRGETAKGSTMVEHPSAKATSDPLTYKVSACVDVSKVTPYKNGKPRKVPPGTSRSGWIYGVTQDSKTLKWYVTTQKQTGTC